MPIEPRQHGEIIGETGKADLYAGARHEGPASELERPPTMRVE